ncbi:MAG: hypothetical protein LBJ11_02590 [Oscillospiraceae bacterium]|jgi:hypothetical protein|nr:hypothetical protein [Oscillospiraceae bacterium]
MKTHKHWFRNAILALSAVFLLLPIATLSASAATSYTTFTYEKSYCTVKTGGKYGRVKIVYSNALGKVGGGKVHIVLRDSSNNWVWEGDVANNAPSIELNTSGTRDIYRIYVKMPTGLAAFFKDAGSISLS